MKPITILLITILFVGCKAVISPEPFGLEPVCLHSKYIVGTWKSHRGEVLQIDVHDKERALLDITLDISGDSSEKSEVHTVRAHLMCGEKWHYVSVPISDLPDTSGDKGYLFACYYFIPGEIRIWGADIDKFKKLVEQEKIDGHIEKTDVVLEEIIPELIDIVESEKYGLLFGWRNPVILQKIKGKESLENEQTGAANSGSAGAPPE